MKVSKLVPEIYYKKSRDFSYVGRVFEIMFNYLKTNVDLVGENPINNEVPSPIIDLLSKTLGFESKHNYLIKDLVALCSSFVGLCRRKGTTQAIEDGIRILLRTQGIESSFERVDDGADKYHLIYYVSPKLKDIVLLEDLFEYILPAGHTCTFRYGLASNVSTPIATPLVSVDTVEPHLMTGYQLGQVSNSGGSSSTTNIDEDAFINRSMTYTGTVPGKETPQQDNSN